MPKRPTLQFHCDIMSHISTRPCIQDFPRRNLSSLKPRDPNACPRFSLQMVSTRKVGDENKYFPPKYAHNPLLQRRAAVEQDRKREVFLKRVRQTSDDKKWESRSEQVGHNGNASPWGTIMLTFIKIMRRDFLARQRQWELDQARAASEILLPLDEEQVEEPGFSKGKTFENFVCSQKLTFRPRRSRHGR